MLQRQGDELLHLFGCHAPGLDLQRDLRAVEAGEDIDWGARQRDRPEQHHGQRKGQHHQPVAQAAVNQKIKHGLAHLVDEGGALDDDAVALLQTLCDGHLHAIQGLHLHQLGHEALRGLLDPDDGLVRRVFH